MMKYLIVLLCAINFVHSQDFGTIESQSPDFDLGTTDSGGTAQANLVGPGNGLGNINLPECTGNNADALQRDCAILLLCSNYVAKPVYDACIDCGNKQYSLTQLNTAPADCQRCRANAVFVNAVNTRQSNFNTVCSSTIQRAQTSQNSGGTSGSTGGTTGGTTGGSGTTGGGTIGGGGTTGGGGGGAFATSNGPCACTGTCRSYALSQSRCPSTGKSCVVSNNCSNGRSSGGQKYLCCS